MTAYVVSLSVQAAVWLSVAVTSSRAVAFPALVLLGLASNTVTVLGGTARQVLTPAVLLGRVSAATRVVGLGAAALGAALGGLVGQAAGIGAPLVVAAGWLALAALVFVPASRGWHRSAERPRVIAHSH